MIDPADRAHLRRDPGAGRQQADDEIGPVRVLKIRSEGKRNKRVEIGFA